MFALFGRVSPAQAKVVLSSRDPSTNRPIKVTRVLPDPNVSPVGHALLALLFYGCFIAYIVIAIQQYIDQPPTTLVSHVDSQDYSVVPMFNVRLGVDCKVDAGSSSSCGDMLLNVNYSSYPLSPCYRAGRVAITRETNSQIQTVPLASGAVFNIKMTPHNAAAAAGTERYFYHVPLCFTAQEPLNLASQHGSSNLPLSMISVGFLGLNESGILGAQMTVDVEYNNNGNNNDGILQFDDENSNAQNGAIDEQRRASRTINVNGDNSVRVLPISGTVERGLDGEVTSYTPSAELVQFEGFRATSASSVRRSDVMITLQSKTVLRKREQVKSLWDLVSNIGSAFETLMGFMPLLLPIWGCLFLSHSNWMSRFVANDRDGASSSSSSTAQSPSSSKMKYAASGESKGDDDDNAESNTASADSSKRAVTDQPTPVTSVVVQESS